VHGRKGKVLCWVDEVAASRSARLTRSVPVSGSGPNPVICILQRLGVLAHNLRSPIQLRETGSVTLICNRHRRMNDRDVVTVWTAYLRTIPNRIIVDW